MRALDGSDKFGPSIKALDLTSEIMLFGIGKTLQEADTGKACYDALNNDRGTSVKDRLYSKK